MPTTTDEQPSYESNVPYFEERRRKLKHYLARFPDGIDFRGKRVLDLIKVTDQQLQDLVARSLEYSATIHAIVDGQRSTGCVIAHEDAFENQ